MRRRVVLAGMAAASVAGPLALPGMSRAQPPKAGQTLLQASASVVKVEADDSAASGFLWPDAQHVVTALHVVDNRRRVTVHFIDDQGRITASSAASVARVLKDADLVMLKLAQPPSRKPLELAAKAPAVKQALDALGFPLNIAGHSSTEVRIRYGGNTLQKILPAKVLRQIADYPNVGLEILNLEGNLVPGLSGAPLLDADGLVVGIADGGLEEGAIGICWGIPAAQLRRLAASNVTTTPRAPRLAQLFAADLQADVRALPGQRPDGLVKLRSRSFAQLQSTADDALGLAQLTQFFGMFRPDQFRYDIYQDQATGATVALPEDARLRDEGGFLVARMPETDLSMKLMIRAVNGPAEAQAQSIRFEQQLTGFGQPGVVVQNDPAWSYLLPMQRGALTVSRKAAGTSRLVRGQWQAESYVFETVATNGRGFLGVAAVNTDVGPSTLLLEGACVQGAADDRCPAMFTRRQRWAQMVLGVQFSSFPQLLG